MEEEAEAVCSGAENFENVWFNKAEGLF